jgi:tetratricopeptide (TPR) repeat protein
VLELQSFLSPVSGQALQDSLKDSSPLVRIAGLRSLEVIPPEHRFAFAGHLLADPLLAVRVEAARVLGPVPRGGLSPGDQQRLATTIAEFVATQELNSDRAETLVNLGNFYNQSGEILQAERTYRRAIDRNPMFIPAFVNLADLFRARGREAASQGVLREGLALHPESAPLHHALGLSLVRAQDIPAALAELDQAAELEPQTVRYAYVYGIALHSNGDSEEAMKVLKQANQAHPRDRDILLTLATISRDRGDISQAREWAGKALDLNPGDQAARQLLDALPAQ